MRVCVCCGYTCVVMYVDANVLVGGLVFVFVFVCVFVCKCFQGLCMSVGFSQICEYTPPNPPPLFNWV